MNGISNSHYPPTQLLDICCTQALICPAYCASIAFFAALGLLATTCTVMGCPPLFNLIFPVNVCMVFIK